MYQIKTDMHVHSIYSNHAYSTIEENARYANEQGMEAIGITDHFGPIFLNDVKEAIYHITNRVVIPDEVYGVRVYKGVEIDIIDHKGNLAFYDMEHPVLPGIKVAEHVLSSCEFVIASVHQNAQFQASNEIEHTQMYINALLNPHVNMIGHSGRSGMTYDIDEVLKVAKEQKKIIEINNHSFQLQGSDVCKKIALRCAELEVMIAVNSDAHFSHSIGKYENALHMLDEIHFPEKLIVNASRSRLESFLKK